MTYEQLKIAADKLDVMLGPDALTNDRGTAEVATLRASVEIALQLAYLNENGLRLQDVAVRGSNLCVSVEQSL